MRTDFVNRSFVFDICITLCRFLGGDLRRMEKVKEFLDRIMILRKRKKYLCTKVAPCLASKAGGRELVAGRSFRVVVPGE